MRFDLKRHCPIPQLIDPKANANALSLTIAEGTHAYDRVNQSKVFRLFFACAGPGHSPCPRREHGHLGRNKMSRRPPCIGTVSLFRAR